jgi:hypothetical protein
MIAPAARRRLRIAILHPELGLGGSGDALERHLVGVCRAAP